MTLDRTPGPSHYLVLDARRPDHSPLEAAYNARIIIAKEGTTVMRIICGSRTPASVRVLAVVVCVVVKSVCKC